MIRLHAAVHAGKEVRNVFRVTLACSSCKTALGTEHRIDFEYEPLPRDGDAARRRAAEAHGSAVRRENVKIMADGGCLDAMRELAP